ncbi:hypothetical protein HY389_00015 [Candidatus Daviesbacteria bacterium]|nr:hypothetical protein [Candidatus Daviesbacteria bacterium]
MEDKEGEFLTHVRPVQPKTGQTDPSLEKAIRVELGLSSTASSEEVKKKREGLIQQGQESALSEPRKNIWQKIWEDLKKAA